MNKAHKKLLLKHRLALVEDLETEDICGLLFQNRILTENDSELVAAEKTRRQRNEALLDMLPRKGPKAYGKFVEALKEIGVYGHLVELLNSALTIPGRNTPTMQGRKPSRGEDLTDSSPVGNIKVPSFPVRPRSSTKAEPDLDNAYPISGNHRGWCLIVNNVEFETLSERRGSDRDAKNLQSLFTALGFTVWIVRNLDSNSIRSKFKDLASKDHKNSDSVVVCLLSHGLSGKIYGTDGELVEVAELISALNFCSTLVGKPKLFFIQACRSIDKQKRPPSGVPIDFSETVMVPAAVEENATVSTVSDEAMETVDTPIGAFVQQNKMPLQADMLLGYSTFPGEVSWRHTEHGSFYIDTMVDVFKQNASWMDVLSMLVVVNEKVLGKVSKFGEKQIPAPVFTLTKKLYLLPVS